MIKSRKEKFIRISLGLTFLYLFVGYLVNKDVFRNLDYNSLIFLQRVLGRFVDLPFSFLTLLGSTEVIFITVFIIFLSFLRRRKHLFNGIFIIFLIYIFELAGKLLIYHPKPPVIFNRYALNIFFPSSFIIQTSFSYPSGHMARISFLTIIILFMLLSHAKYKLQKTFFWIASTVFVILIFVSRIYLGAHWFSDVLGGLLLGSSLATFALSFW